ncbi:MAG: RNA polymerase factor sigma-32 [Alphaproteobacteria bacterium]
MASFTTSRVDPGSRRYMASVMQAPVLEREEEFDLARRWRDDQDEDALHRLVEAYARFVVRIAWGFRGYGLPVADLVQEGNIGLMEAAARFDPERSVRFSTYASWWIMAAIQDHILRTNSIVRVATTPTQRRLFFNLRRARARLAENPSGPMTDADREKVAEALSVKPSDVMAMEAHLGGPDNSLNAPVGGEEDGAEGIEFLMDDMPNPEELVGESHDHKVRVSWLHEALDHLTPRERRIIVRRFLGPEKTTLAEIGDDFGVSKERIRQIEAKALDKLRENLGARVGESGLLFSN